MSTTSENGPIEKPELFLSHLASDADLVGRVADLLEAKRIRCFHAGKHISDADEWLRTIERALLRCDALVAFVRPEFKASDWTDHEVGYALGRKKLVVPVMLEPGFTPYGFFNRFQAIDGRGPTDEVARRILEALWQPGSVRSKLVERVYFELERTRDDDLLDQMVLRLERLSDDELDRHRLDQARCRNILLQDPPFERRMDALLARSNRA